MAKAPTKPVSAIDTPAPVPTPTPASAPATQPWVKPEITPLGTEPPAGTPMTAEELAANGVTPRVQPADANGNEVEDDAGHEDGAPENAQPDAALNAPAPEPVAPIEDKLTLGLGDGDANAGDIAVPEDMPTDGTGRPDGFIVGDQTAAGAITPPGGQHPGAPKSLHPGQPINLQDPHNVNGTARNQELLAAGHGIKNPLLGEDYNPAQADDKNDD